MLELAGVTHSDVQARGMRFHVAEAGPADAPPVFLTHGWPQHWWTWRNVIPALAESHRVFAWDLRGMGWSDPAPDGDYTKTAMADDLLGLMDALEVERAGLGRARLGRVQRHAGLPEGAGPLHGLRFVLDPASVAEPEGPPQPAPAAAAHLSGPDRHAGRRRAADAPRVRRTAAEGRARQGPGGPTRSCTRTRTSCARRRSRTRPWASIASSSRRSCRGC